MVALSELGYIVDMQQIYVNSYTNDELFGQIDSKTGLNFVLNLKKAYYLNNYIY